MFVARSSDKSPCVLNCGWSGEMGTMPGSESNSRECVLALKSDIAELERLTAYVDAFCQSAEVPAKTCYMLQVVLEELVLNSVKYGECEAKEGAIRLEMRRENEEGRIVFSDEGIRFNPLDVPSPDLTGSINDRPLGGLGIHLVRSFMPSIRYERHEGRNYLYLSRPVNPESGTVSPEGGTHASGVGNSQD